VRLVQLGQRLAAQRGQLWRATIPWMRQGHDQFALQAARRAAEDQHAVAEVEGFVEVMGDQQHGDFVAGGQFGGQVLQLHAGPSR